MNLFDKFNQAVEKIESKVYKPNSEQEAFFAIIWLFANIDDDIMDLETHRIADYAISKTLFKGFDTGIIAKQVHISINGIDPKVVINSCLPLVSKEIRPMLLCLVMDIILADGQLKDDEKMAAEYLAVQFNIEDELVQKIIEVMIIKNQGNVVFN